MQKSLNLLVHFGYPYRDPGGVSFIQWPRGCRTAKVVWGGDGWASLPHHACLGPAADHAQPRHCAGQWEAFRALPCLVFIAFVAGGWYGLGTYVGEGNVQSSSAPEGTTGGCSLNSGTYQAFKWSFNLLQASGLQRFGIDTQIDCFGRSDQIQQPVETDFGPNRTNCNRTGHFDIASTLPPWHLPRRLRSRPSWNGSFLRTICELCSPWSRHSGTWKRVTNGRWIRRCVWLDDSHQRYRYNNPKLLVIKVQWARRVYFTSIRHIYLPYPTIIRCSPDGLIWTFTGHPWDPFFLGEKTWFCVDFHSNQTSPANGRPNKARLKHRLRPRWAGMCVGQLFRPLNPLNLLMYMAQTDWSQKIG